LAGRESVVASRVTLRETGRVGRQEATRMNFTAMQRAAQNAATIARRKCGLSSVIRLQTDVLNSGPAILGRGAFA